MSTFRHLLVVRKGTAGLLALALAVSGLLPFSIPPASASDHGSVAVIVQKVEGSGNAAEELVDDLGGSVSYDLSIINGFAATIDRSKLNALQSSSSVAHVTEDGAVYTTGLLGGVLNGVTGAVEQTVNSTLNGLSDSLLPSESEPVVESPASPELVGDPAPEVVRKPSPVDAKTGAISVYKDEIGATAANAQGITGKGVTVALIDTGVTAIPDLASRLVQVKAPDGSRKSCVNMSGEATCDDTYGHGTFIAGLIAGTGAASNGKYTGVAPDAKILSIKIAGRDGSSSVGKIIYAIQWVAKHGHEYGVKVLNLALGTDSTQSYKVDPLNYAVERAWLSGISVVVSAGNSGDRARTISKPADDPLVITTGAVDDKHTAVTSDDVVPTFSSRGPTAADGLTKPDITTPGTLLISTRAPGSAIEEQYPGGGVDATYRRGSGTSQSAGVLSGSIALLLQKHPRLTPNQVKYALMKSTTSLTGVSDPNVVGSGLVNVGSAINNLPVGEANQGVKLSNGRGSLDLSRGSWCVIAKEGKNVLGVLNGVLPIKKGQSSDPSGLGWYGTGWYGGDRCGNRTSCDETKPNGGGWYGGGWYSGWCGGGWYGGGSCDDVDPNGGGWYGGGWYSGGWCGGGWYGGGWYGGGWYGGGWYGGGWYGGGWYGSGWYGVWD